MHVSSRIPGRRGGAGGFTLLEVVIAAGLMLITVTAVTLCVTSVSRTGAGLERTMTADRALRRVAQGLRGLSFCGQGPPHVVGAVFPHAQVARNTPAARYVAASGDPLAPAGSFVTLIDEGDVEVRCVARFAQPDGTCLGPSAVAGWGAGDPSTPPAARLAVTLTAQGFGGERTLFLAFSALDRLPAAAPDEGGAS